MENKIHVTGKGSVHVVPDVTRLTISVDRVYKTYEEAYLKAKKNSKWICDILEYNHKSGKMAKEEGDTKFAPRTKEMLLLDYVVAGTTYCKDKALKKKDFIKEGQTLRMLREENVHDANAIALYVEDVKIGYVPKAHNTVVARLMDAGKLLVSRVCKLPDSDGWKKIEAKIWMIEL